MSVWKRILVVVVVGGVISANVFALLAWRGAGRTEPAPPNETPEPTEARKETPFELEVDDDFRIGQRDVLCVQCRWKHPDTDREQCLIEDFEVGPDGKLKLNQYGEVYVLSANLSAATREVRKHLTQKIGAALNVSVTLVTNNHQSYCIVTKLSDRKQTIHHSLNSRDTVWYALATCGLSEMPATNRVWIVRNKATIPVDWAAMVDHEDDTTNHRLLDGDVIHVVKAE